LDKGYEESTLPDILAQAKAGQESQKGERQQLVSSGAPSSPALGVCWWDFDFLPFPKHRTADASTEMPELRLAPRPGQTSPFFSIGTFRHAYL